LASNLDDLPFYGRLFLDKEENSIILNSLSKVNIYSEYLFSNIFSGVSENVFLLLN